MTNDALTAAEATPRDNLILLDSGRGVRIEMTRANQQQLEREMVGMFVNPLTALMAQVAIEYREMATSPARSAGEPR